LTITDLETGLAIGDPDGMPFTNNLDIDKLQQNIEQRQKLGIASASGIRQIFDATYKDDATDYTDGTGTEITDAAKIHIATIADCFIDLLCEHSKKSRPKIVVAIDSRHTGPAIADIIIRTLLYRQVKVLYPFIIPITELAVYSREVSDGFIYISASHNPKGYNGLKLGFDDGRLLPGDIARAFINTYQAKLNNKQNTIDMINHVNSVKADQIQSIYEKIDRYRNESRNKYANFSDMLITGIKNPQNANEQKDIIKEKIKSRDIWIGIDYNGGARKDKDYLESWGFNVLELNNRPRIDMVHELSPIPIACQQAHDALVNHQKEGKNIVAFFVYDTDGDRKNIVIPNGKGGAIIPGVQMIFALDVLCSILNAQNAKDNKEIAVVVNDATSSIIEQLAAKLSFRVRRVEVGEANVASAGVNMDKQGFCVPIMGEGSNGSVFDLGLLVREPLHTIRTIIDFITKAELTKSLLNQMRVDNVYDSWHSKENIGGLFINIINALPPSLTTDFFTDEGVYKSKHDIPQEQFKANFDAYFETVLWETISKEIKLNYDGEPIAEFANCEGEEELKGCGNRKKGNGGYKIEFYVVADDKIKHHIGWIWFRTSATERGIIRRGVSISHWEINHESVDIVKRMYNYMNKTFIEALDFVEKETLKGIRL
jgi:phosphoglucomutase